MDIKSGQVLTKTPQGVNATRSGVGLSPKAYAMLKLFDGTMPVSEFVGVCKAASISDVNIKSTLAELVQLDHLRLVSADSGADGASRESSSERRMLLTLDFTVAGEVPSRKPAAQATTLTAPKMAAIAAPRAGGEKGPAAAPVTAAELAIDTAEADDKTARLKRETEIRQKLMAALQPRIEEELRTRLRPKLEQELRPKLIAALRPGLEAEVRTALTQELAPRVELELKARFAKTLAARKQADEKAAQAEPPAETRAAVAAPAPADEATTRLLACLGVPVFTVDKAGVCNYMSPAWAQLSGFAVGDVVGKPLVDFFGDRDRRAMLAMLTGISNGTALRFEQQGQLLRKEGEPLWVEMSAAPFTAANGQANGVCGTLRDVTDQRRAALQAESDGVRLLLLVDQIDTGVILEDSEGNIQQANPALCTLLSLDAAPYSLEGMPVSELLETAARGFMGPEGYLRRVAELRAAKEDAKGESFVMADGRVIEQDYLAVTVDNGTVGYLWLLREMTRQPSRGAS
jgi:PAS domain S-box-containing protein